MRAKILVLLILAFLVGSATRVEGFCGGIGCSPAVHQEVTANALSFIEASVLADINDEHAFQEIFGALDADEHFDGCSFSGGAAEINANYQDALNQADPNNFDSGDLADQFGQLLHAVQDFYSHSNWVDLGQTTLVDEGLGLWSPMNPYSLREGVLFVQGEDETPFGSDSSLSIVGKVVMVNTGNSPPAGLPIGTYKGVISGTFGPDDCPNNVSLSHGDLNKDVPGKTNFDDAKDLALKQTSHEWCRLVNLVEQRYPGTGKQALFDNWVVDENKANSTCGGKVDVVLIIDSSGSMENNDPNNNRLAAGRAYLTASLEGDFVGVVDFDSGARIASSLQKLPDNKNSLISAINTIDSSGGTNIGLGIQAGCDVLIASTSANTTKGAILLTDGQGDFSNQDSCFSTRGWKIFTFGFGSSDDALLQQIASNTGGEFKRLPTSNFVCEFQAVRSKIADGSPGTCTAFHVNPNSTTSFPASVPSGQGQATFSSSWSGSDVVMTLITPSGRVINRETISPDIVHEVEPTFEIYTITNPEAGEWQVDLFGADVPPEGEEVIFGISTIPASNLPPTADAGLDQIVVANSSSGVVDVSLLDGFGSSDPDGDPLAFFWSASGITFDNPTSPTPRAIFPVGTTTVTLVVNDGTVDSAPDTVDITVLGPRDLKQGAIDKLSMHMDESKKFKKAIKDTEKSLDDKFWADEMHLDPKNGKKVFDYERHAVKELMYLLKGVTDDKCGGITDIALQYTGPDTITVEAFLKKTSLGIFEVSTGDIFAVLGTAETKDRLDPGISLVVDGKSVAKIDTSCARPIDIGDVYGDFIIDDLGKLPPKKSGRQVSQESREVAQTAIDDLVTADRVLALVLLEENGGLVAVNPENQDKVEKELQKARDELVKGDGALLLKPDGAIQRYRKSWEHAGHAAKEAEKE